MTIQHLYGGDFYTVKHVQTDEIVFMDIWMLVESIDNAEDLKHLKDLNEDKAKKSSSNVPEKNP